MGKLQIQSFSWPHFFLQIVSHLAPKQLKVKTSTQAVTYATIRQWTRLPLGPPMWGDTTSLQKNTIDNEDFVQSMVDFVKKPTLETAIHDMAVEQMGLMPALPLPDNLLKKIATYILEEQFPPPCDHWVIAVKRATEKGDLEHAKKDQRMLDRFCKK